MIKMNDVFAQIAQGLEEDNGRGWSRLLFLAIFILIPLVNAIKDKFVRRAEEKRAEQAAAGMSETTTRTKLRPVQPKHEMAKPLGPRPVTRTRAEGPGPREAKPLGPAEAAPRPAPARPVPSPPPQKQMPPVARPPRPAPQPTPRAVPLQERVVREPAKPVRQAVARKREVRRRRSAVAGVDVHGADPTVDVHGADPTVRVRAARPKAEVRQAAPAVDVQEAALAGPEAGPRPGAGVFDERPTPEQMRRAVVLSEILRPPLALRSDSRGGWDLRT
jgi:hypothetical protein